ncbi:MAG: hypothetical protein L6Q78_09935 [Bacteroidia bacterium]|nr:hypothetical protein [Bacteroidia bacterium]
MSSIKSKLNWDWSPWLVVFAACLLFIGYQSDRLNSPFFWDEAWVYAPALRTMAESGPGLLPSSLDPSLSRGHPLLFHFLGSSWIQLFGNSPMAMHSFAISLSLTSVILLFAFLKLQGNAWIALILSAGYLFAQEVFRIQGIMVLPEIMLGIWVTGLLWAFKEKKSWFVFLFLSLGLLSKESFIPIALALFLAQILATLRANSRKNLGLLLAFVGGFMSLFVFFLIQKLQHGWWLYPLHQGMIELDSWQFAYKLRVALRFILWEQNRWIFTLLFLGLSSSYLIKNKGGMRIGLFLIVLIFLYRNLIEESVHTDWLSYLLLASIAGILITRLFQLAGKESQENEYFSLSLILTSCAYLVFSSLNFFTERYLMLLFPIVAIGLFQISTQFTNQKIISIFLGLALLGNAFFPIPKTKIDDVSKGGLDAISLQKEALGFLTGKANQNDGIMAPFLIQTALRDPGQGYLPKQFNFAFSNVHGLPIDAEDKFLVQTSWEKFNLIPDSTQFNQFQRVFEREQGLARIEIFQRIQNPQTK